MADNLVYSQKSLIAPATDLITSQFGDIVRSGDSLTMPAGSSVIYTYNYNTTNNVLRTDNLRFMPNLSSTSSLGTAYNPIVSVEFKILYYLPVDDTYEDGASQSFVIYPYFVSESLGYFGYYDIELNNSNFIKSIVITFSNTSNAPVVFRGTSLLYSQSLAQGVTGIVNTSISLAGVHWYPNGFRVIYNGSDDADKFFWVLDNSDNLAGININGERLVPFWEHTELLE